MSDSIFCVDLGEYYIKVAQVDHKKKILEIKAAAFNEIPFNPYASSAEEVFKKSEELLVKLIADASIKHQDVNIIIPDSQSYTRIFEMPLLTDKELLSAIKYQADQFIPIPIDKVSLDVHILHKDKQNNKVDILLVAAANTVIENIVQIVESASLMPVSIENEASATVRLITTILKMEKQKNRSTDECEVFINFGNSSTSLYLFSVTEQRPLQVHNFTLGRSIFYRDILSNYSLNDQQIKDLIENIGFSEDDSTYDLHQLLAAPLNEFVSEVKRFLMSTKEGASGKVRNIYLLGEGSKFAFLDKKLSSLLGQSITPLNLSEYVSKNSVSDYFKQDWPLLAPVIGGALR